MDQENRYFDQDSVRNSDQNIYREKNKKDAAAFIGGIIIGILSTLLVVCIILTIGTFTLKKRPQQTEPEVKEKTEGLLDEETINKLKILEDKIHERFYLHEVSDEELRNGIYKGMLKALDDPYSEYYTAEEFEELMAESEGIYYGIGAYISLDKETTLPKISGIIKNTPAQEVGLQNEDLIYMVDGESVYGDSLTEAVSKIKGPENTQVVLTIIRGGEQMDVEVTRRKVESPTVESKMLENDMGYLQITQFDEVTFKQFMEALDGLKASGMKGMILDLRSNPGGNLSTVVDIARNLLPEGIIVYTEDKEGHRVTYRSKGENEFRLPLVVLVDMNSASASEILAGAIQDCGKGTLIGTTTFGKGIVQSVEPLKDGSAIKLTISSYFTPNGRNIHGIGIEPDIICEFDGSGYYDAENPVDNQLEKAKEVLAGMMN